MLNDPLELVKLIRSEMDLALKPVREDLHELKSSQYTKEVLDKMFEIRDNRIKHLEDGWATLLTRVGAGVGALYGIIYLWNLLHK